jgi:hypothetical protein
MESYYSARNALHDNGVMIDGFILAPSLGQFDNQDIKGTGSDRPYVPDASGAE